MTCETSRFHCVRCGECCRHIHPIKGWKDLQANGVCKFLIDNQCSIYENRPNLCRYDAVYELFKAKMSLQEYDEMVMHYCQQLQDLKKAKDNQ